MKNSILIVVIFCLNINLTVAQNFTSTDSKVDFKIKNAGFWVHGNFEGINTELILNNLDWDSAKLTGTVEVASIKTGIKFRDKHLKNDDYFDTEQFPNISLELLSCDSVKETILNAKFKLTIKKTSKVVEIPLVIKERETGLSISGSFIINRLDFELGKNSLTLSNNVEIDFYSFFSAN